MTSTSATAVANANVAFIKYEGNTDEALRLPAKASLSMNSAGLETESTDEVLIGGEAQTGAPYDRV